MESLQSWGCGGLGHLEGFGGLWWAGAREKSLPSLEELGLLKSHFLIFLRRASAHQGGCQRNKAASKSRTTQMIWVNKQNNPNNPSLEVILLISGGRNGSCTPWGCSCFLRRQRAEVWQGSEMHILEQAVQSGGQSDDGGQKHRKFAKLKVRPDIWLKIMPFQVTSGGGFISMGLFQFHSSSLWN